MDKKVSFTMAFGLSVAGTGYVRRGGGTLASLIALGAAWLLIPYPLISAISVIILLAFGVWGSFYAQKRDWKKDDSRITVDELCGMLIAFLLIPLPASIWGRIIIFVLGFAVYRLLDIFKPPPVNLIEKLPGGWGVMADDVVAGLITNGLLRLIILIPIPIIHGY